MGVVLPERLLARPGPETGLAPQAEPEDAGVRAIRAAAYAEWRRRETRLTAKGVFGAARENGAKTGG